MRFRAELLERTLDELERTHSYRVFAAFVRMGEVRRWLQRDVPVSERDYAAALADLDYRQADLLPEKIDDVAVKTQKRLRAIFEFVLVQLRKKGAKGMLFAIRRADAASPPHPLPPVDAAPPPRLLPSGWKPNLPLPPAYEELRKVSPTRLDAYLRCPFTFFLGRKDVWGDRRPDDTAADLASWECGNVVHAALEAWGNSDLHDSSDEPAIAEFLSGQVDVQLAERFGASVPSAVVPQGEDVRRRLASFAAWQVAHRADGWRIAAVERKMEMTVGHTLVYGKCDRIDVSEKTGRWLVVDYKCRDSADFDAGASLQLPLYRAMVAASEDPLFVSAKEEDVACCYCVLPKAPSACVSVSCPTGEPVEVALAKARSAIDRIERGVFWPPSPSGLWRREFRDWLAPSPESSVSEEWLSVCRTRARNAQ